MSELFVKCVGPEQTTHIPDPGLDIWRSTGFGARLRVGCKEINARLVSKAQLEDKSMSVLVLGRILDADTGASLDADDLLAMAAANSLHPENFDGAFLLVIAEPRRHQMRIINDRYASLPLYYAQDSTGADITLASRPETVLAGSQRAARLNISAAFSFLLFGHCLHDKTLFEGIHLMLPASVLEIGTQTQTLKLTPYWRPNFQPSAKRATSDLCAEFAAHLSAAVRRGETRRGERSAMLLTGGYDSRALIALAKQEDALPDLAITWGASDAIAGTDVDIAARLAKMGGVPHHFIKYSADGITEHARDWISWSGMSTDNAGNFVVSRDFLTSHLGAGDHSVIIGDQMIGPSGFPADRKDAVRAILGLHEASASAGLGSWLQPSARKDVNQMVARDIAQATNMLDADHPKDLQDGLFWSAYVVRWLMAEAYFREPQVSVIRPLLDRNVVNFVQTLPRTYRVDKRMLIETMGKAAPEFMAVPPASAASLINWKTEFRTNPTLHLFMAEALQRDRLEQLPIAHLLDLDALDAAIGQVRGMKAAKETTGDALQARLLGVRRFISRSETAARLARHAQRAMLSLQGKGGDNELPVHILGWRLALLSMFYTTFIAASPGQISGQMQPKRQTFK